MTQRSPLITLAILTLFWAMVGGARAATPLNGCFVVWRPYTDIVDGKPAGITTDIVREAAKRAGYQLTLSGFPWKRCLVMVQRAEMDFAMDAVDRPGYIHGKHPSALYIQAFWTRESEDYGRFDYIGRLTDKRLGLMQGFQYGDEILNAGFKVIEWVRTEQIAAQLVELDRLDLVYADAVVMRDVIRRNQFHLKPMLPVHSVQALYPSFNVSMPEKRDRFDKAMAALHADGTVDRIYKRHTGFDFSTFVALGSQARVPATTN